MKNLHIKYLQKQTVLCSLKIVLLLFSLLLVYSLFAIQNTLPFPGWSVWVPLGIGVILVPLQALFFDWFQANGKYLEIKDNKIIYTYSPNSLYRDTNEVEIFELDDIKKMKVFFRKFNCLRTIEIIFKNGKKLYVMGFYIKKNDFETILDRLEKQGFREEK